MIKRVFKEAIRIDAIFVKTTSGTCNVTIQVDGTNVGTAVAASSTASESNLANSILVDATTVSKTIGFEASSVSSAVGLEVVLAVAKQSV